MAKPVQCRKCGSPYHYQSFCPLNRKPLPRSTKPIKPGKHTLKDRRENKKFRDSKLNFEGYLVCECCGSWNGSDADHTLGKGSHPEVRYDPNFKQILCRFPCHDNKTNNRSCPHP